jgi:hypothetical protein
MNINEVKDAIKPRKGANLAAVWNRPLKTRKGVEDVITKRVEIVVRGGISYDNREVVKESREDGTLPAENAGLPWGEWAEYPIHITHKGADYVRMYPASGVDFTTNKPFVAHTEYFKNGVKVEKSDIEGVCLASEFRKEDEAPLCYTIKLENIESIRVKE